MNETMRQGLATGARRSVSERPADLDSAVRNGMLAYHRRILWAQTAAVLTVAILTGGFVLAWSTAYRAPDSTDIAVTRVLGTSTATGTATGPAAVLTTIRITPRPMTVRQGGQQQATAAGVYSDGTTKPLGSPATWSIGDAEIADVNTQGLVHGNAPGTTTITATGNGVTSTATLTVTSPTAVLTSIRIAPSPVTVRQGEEQQATATGVYSDGTTKPLGSAVIWSIDNTKIADVKAKGLVHGNNPGKSTITATATENGITGSATVTVEEAPTTPDLPPSTTDSPPPVVE